MRSLCRSFAAASFRASARISIRIGSEQAIDAPDSISSPSLLATSDPVSLSYSIQADVSTRITRVVGPEVQTGLRRRRAWQAPPFSSSDFQLEHGAPHRLQRSLCEGRAGASLSQAVHHRLRCSFLPYTNYTRTSREVNSFKASSEQLPTRGTSAPRETYRSRGGIRWVACRCCMRYIGQATAVIG